MVTNGRNAHTKRTYGSKTDAYAVFKRMLDKGNPPDDWETLLEASWRTESAERLEKARRAPGAGRGK